MTAAQTTYSTKHPETGERVTFTKGGRPARWVTWGDFGQGEGFQHIGFSAQEDYAKAVRAPRSTNPHAARYEATEATAVEKAPAEDAEQAPAPAAAPRKVRLQYVGWVPAVEARELVVGDQVMYNGGSVCQISAIEEASARFLYVYEVCTEKGTESRRKVRKDSPAARVPEEHRRPLGHESAPARHYRAQVCAPHGDDAWVTVSHGATVDEAGHGLTRTGRARSYFSSLLLDAHGLGYRADNVDGRAESVQAMTEGQTLTAEDGHRFRILAPEQPPSGTETGTVDEAAQHRTGCLPESANAPQVKAAKRVLAEAGQPLAAFDAGQRCASEGVDLDPRTDTGEVVLGFVAEHWRTGPPPAERERIVRDCAALFRKAGWAVEEFWDDGRLARLILTPPPTARERMTAALDAYGVPAHHDEDAGNSWLVIPPIGRHFPGAGTPHLVAYVYAPAEDRAFVDDPMEGEAGTWLIRCHVGTAEPVVFRSDPCAAPEDATAEAAAAVAAIRAAWTIG
ncbi:hypothetical protein ACTWJ8_39800 (plasmid) [Streptomyces sp. SDT5-1]|uniref:hypothetical protein n=1 Tax=Streptomyces sp. SDT5-1 TaxID=3406418 RepID=UPI003FD12AF8